MTKEDLLEHAKSTEDFYKLLEVAFETSEADIRRAYRKTALKYHPDKLGAAFDPDKFHLLQIAYDVLTDPAAKAIYDQGRHAKVQKEKQNALFEGKRRMMKEELEARERSGATTFGGSFGAKREREEDDETINLRKLMEAGKRRRLAEEEKKRAAGLDTPSKIIPTPQAHVPVVSPSAHPKMPSPPHTSTTMTAEEEQAEEDEIAKLERRIKEAELAKARRKAEKKARNSGIYVAADSPAGKQPAGAAETTPMKRPDPFSSLKADSKLSASPKFSFSSSPSVTPKAKDNGGFAATMERLKEAERRRLEEEIRKQEAAES